VKKLSHFFPEMISEHFSDNFDLSIFLVHNTARMLIIFSGDE